MSKKCEHQLKLFGFSEFERDGKEVRYDVFECVNCGYIEEIEVKNVIYFLSTKI